MTAIARNCKRFLWVIPFLFVGATQATPLTDPEPVLVPVGLSDQSVAQAVRLGSAKRGWMITRDEPGQMEATLHARVHTAKVTVGYDTRSVRIRYLGSENLEYEEKKGKQHIHGNYNKWVQNLALAISAQLAMLPPDAK